MDKGHGRIETRTLISTTILNDYIDWPELAQVFCLTRTRTQGGKLTTEIAYGITSLNREEANAKRLLELVRGHWSIENQLHRVRDVTFGEDGCRVRSGSAPQVLAAIRNTAIVILRKINPKNIAAAIRFSMAKPRRTLKILQEP